MDIGIVLGVLAIAIGIVGFVLLFKGRRHS